jgi:hypothetical protein
MPESRSRRPLPALFFLLILVCFTAIVWWRVLQRGESRTTSGHSASPTTSASHAPSAPASCTTKPVIMPKPADVKVNVYNGAERSGLAGSTQTELIHRGFQVPNIGNAAKTLTGVAEVQYGPSGALAARLVQMYVPGSTLTASTRADATVDLVLGKAFKTLAVQRQVDLAVAAAARKC